MEVSAEESGMLLPVFYKEQCCDVTGLPGPGVEASGLVRRLFSSQGRASWLNGFLWCVPDTWSVSPPGGWGTVVGRKAF